MFCKLDETTRSMTIAVASLFCTIITFAAAMQLFAMQGPVA